MNKRKRHTIAAWPHKPFAVLGKPDEGAAVAFYYACHVPKAGRFVLMLTEANGKLWELRITPGGKVSVYEAQR